jgi:hypothetical protein
MKRIAVIAAVPLVLGVAAGRAEDVRLAPAVIAHSPLPSPAPVGALLPWPIRDSDIDHVPLDLVLAAARRQNEMAVTPALPRPAAVRASISAQQMDVPRRPVWSWPPLSAQWGAMPGPAAPSWQWQAGWQSAPSGSIRLASLAPSVAPKPPWWLAGVWTVTAADAMPSWPRVRAADLRLPAGRSRPGVADTQHLEPPSRFLRWTGRIEAVLADDGEVDRLCRASGAKSPPGGFIRGCARGVAGRCFIIRVDDPGVARHELAHCNGWPANHPQ